jgi:hypothetical protein
MGREPVLAGDLADQPFALVGTRKAPPPGRSFLRAPKKNQKSFEPSAARADLFVLGDFRAQ